MTKIINKFLLALFIITLTNCKPIQPLNDATTDVSKNVSLATPAEPVPSVPESELVGVTSSSGSVSITEYTGKEKNIVIPATMGGQPVISIGDPNNPTNPGPFENKGLTSVILPDSVQFIAKAAFANNNITILVLPKDLKTIGDNAFWHNSITSLTIPDGVETIGDHAFHFNAISGHLVLPDSVTSIGEFAFQSNPLTSLTLGNRITEIGARAFAQSTTFPQVVINSVTITRSVPPIIVVDAKDAQAIDRRSTFTAPDDYYATSATPPMIGVHNLYVPALSVSAYQNNAHWNSYFTHILAIP